MENATNVSNVKFNVDEALCVINSNQNECVLDVMSSDADESDAELNCCIKIFFKLG